MHPWIASSSFCRELAECGRLRVFDELPSVESIGADAYELRRFREAEHEGKCPVVEGLCSEAMKGRLANAFHEWVERTFGRQVMREAPEVGAWFSFSTGYGSTVIRLVCAGDHELFLREIPDGLLLFIDLRDVGIPPWNGQLDPARQPRPFFGNPKLHLIYDIGGLY